MNGGGRRDEAAAGAAWRAILLPLCLLAACQAPEEPAAEARAVIAVEVISPWRQSLPEEISASGEIAPWDEAIVGAELGGLRLEQVLVDVGSPVKKGQLLARLNDRPLRAALERLDANLLVARANLAKARADLARAERLLAASAISGQAVDSYRTQAEVAAAELAAAAANRKAQAIDLASVEVRAPDDGLVSSRSATVGAVTVLGAELFRIVRQGRIEWRAEVPDLAYARLQPGTRAALQALDGSVASGTLRELSPLIHRATRNGIAYVDLPATASLVPGMYVSGRFQLAEREATVLPESAVVLRDGSRYLMQVGGDQRVRAVKVQTGRRVQHLIEVLGDVSPAQRYVKSGAAFVNDGDLVRVTTGAAP